MATNLEKLKAEIAEMSAEEFSDFEQDFNMCAQISGCRDADCRKCRVKWLHSESEEEK